MIVLDTDVLIEIFDKGSEKGDLAIQELEGAGEEIAITSITYHEILYGFEKYGKKRIIKLEQLETLDFTKSDAKLSAKLELDCERKGKMVSRMDSMIAGMVINRNAKLYTFNKKHFINFNKLQLI
jgi:tRNA(fMet)-specific endonuclease VapC